MKSKGFNVIRHLINAIRDSRFWTAVSIILGFVSIVLAIWPLISEFKRAGILFEYFEIGKSDQGVVYVSSEKSLNLQYWTDHFTITGNGSDTAIWPTEVALQTVKATLIRTSTDAEIAYFRMGTGGDPPIISCFTQKFKITRTKHPLFGDKGSSWYLVVDISETPLEDPFIILYQVAYLKGFQGQSQFTTLQGDHSWQYISLEAQFPNFKHPHTLKTGYYLRGQNPQQLKSYQSTAEANLDSTKIYWRINQPTLNYNYTLSWTW